ncbi:MAG: hypothetical protein CMQ65_03165 [Gammaproteobacteria bacterium]|nr:hypothetical protein [Gammaproteobacteria bacterium]
MKKIILIFTFIFSFNAHAHTSSDIFHLHINEYLITALLLSFVLAFYWIRTILKKGDINV